MRKKLKKSILFGLGALTITSAVTSAVVLSTNKNTQTSSLNSQENVIGSISTQNSSSSSNSFISLFSTNDSSSSTSNVSLLNNITLPAHIFSETNLKDAASEIQNTKFDVSTNSETNNQFTQYVQNEEAKLISYIQEYGLQENGFTNLLQNQLDVPVSFVDKNVMNNNTISVSYTSYLWEWINWNSKYWLNKHSLQDTIEAFDDISSITPWKFIEIKINNQPIRDGYYYHFLKTIALSNVTDGKYEISLITQPGIYFNLNNTYIQDGSYHIVFDLQNTSNIATTNGLPNVNNTDSSSSTSNSTDSTITNLSNEIASLQTQVQNDENNDGMINYTTMTEQRYLAWEEAEYVKAVTNNSSSTSQAFAYWNTMNGYYHYEFSWWDILCKHYYHDKFMDYIDDISNLYEQAVNTYNEESETPFEILTNNITQTQNQLSEEEAVDSEFSFTIMTQQRLLAWYQYEYIKYVTKNGQEASEALNDWNLMNQYYHYTFSYDDVACRLYYHDYFKDYIDDISKLYTQEELSYNLTPNSSLATLNNEIQELSPIVKSEEQSGQYILNSNDMAQARMLALYECEYLQEAGYTSLATTDFGVWNQLNDYYKLTLTGMQDWNKETPWYFTQYCLYLKEIQSSYNNAINPYSTGLDLMQRAIKAVDRYASEEYGVAIASSVATAISIATAAAYWAGSWFFGITVPEAIAATTAAVSTASTMAAMWTSYHSTQTLQKEIEDNSFSWMSIKSDKKFYSTMKKDWKKFRKYFTKTYKAITKAVKVISAIEDATVDACSWADPILLVVGVADLALATSILFSNMVINAVNTTWLNVLFLE